MSKMNMLAVVSAVQTIASSEKIDVGISLLQAVAPNVPAEKPMFAERFPDEILVERLLEFPDETLVERLLDDGDDLFGDMRMVCLGDPNTFITYDQDGAEDLYDGFEVHGINFHKHKRQKNTHIKNEK